MIRIYLIYRGIANWEKHLYSLLSLLYSGCRWGNDWNWCVVGTVLASFRVLLLESLCLHSVCPTLIWESRNNVLKDFDSQSSFLFQFLIFLNRLVLVCDKIDEGFGCVLRNNLKRAFFWFIVLAGVCTHPDVRLDSRRASSRASWLNYPRSRGRTRSLGKSAGSLRSLLIHQLNPSRYWFDFPQSRCYFLERHHPILSSIKLEIDSRCLVVQRRKAFWQWLRLSISWSLVSSNTFSCLLKVKRDSLSRGLLRRKLYNELIGLRSDDKILLSSCRALLSKVG